MSLPEKFLPKKSKTKKKGKRRIIGLTIFILLFLVALTFLVGYKFKGFVLVATVDGKPIYSWQYARRLWKRFGQAALEDLVLEILVIEEANKKGVSVSSEEIQQEIETIKNQFGSQTGLEKALATQNLTFQDFQTNLRLQLLVDKLLEEKVSVTDQEIEAFIRQYELQMEATEEAGLKKEAQKSLKAQKMSQAYEVFFPELKEQAKINKFLKF